MDPNTGTTPQQPKNNMMMIVIGIVVLILIGVGVMFAMNRNVPPEQAVQDTSTAQPTATETPRSVGPNDSEEQATMEREAQESGEVKEFTISGRNFSFSPSVIRVNQGDTVRVIFENTGGTHDFVIDEFDVATAQIQGGQSETVTFVADQAGTFDFYCSVGQHRANGMEGQLIVE